VVAPFAIEAVGIEKSFGRTHALAGLGLAVQPGTILGLLGPNGSGNTTAVPVLTTLLRPDRGIARVAGYDVVAQAPQVRRLIGLAGQSAALDESLTGSGNLVMIGQLCRFPRQRAQQRAEELLARSPQADVPGPDFRADRCRRPEGQDVLGGMRRSLDLAASLVTRPPILFLDEPRPVLTPAAA
jgi:ABC-type multidrug transport system ATPase subunit